MDAPTSTTSVAEQVAARTLAKRGAAYTDEVRRLLDAGLALMVERGVGGPGPRVADIVAAAGLSNDAFYRHFPSKGALVAALVEDGAQRLAGYLGHRMAKADDPAVAVRQWVEGVLAQAEGEVAAQTRAVLWNAPDAAGGAARGRHPASGALAALLVPPLSELGSRSPDLHARLLAHATLGLLADHLWAETAPAPSDVEDIAAFWLGAVRA